MTLVRLVLYQIFLTSFIFSGDMKNSQNYSLYSKIYFCKLEFSFPIQPEKISTTYFCISITCKTLNYNFKLIFSIMFYQHLHFKFLQIFYEIILPDLPLFRVINKREYFFSFLSVPFRQIHSIFRQCPMISSADFRLFITISLFTTTFNCSSK